MSLSSYDVYTYYADPSEGSELVGNIIKSYCNEFDDLVLRYRGK